MEKKNILFLITFFFVLSLFSYLFYLSTNYVINYWTFSQAHINYSDGFVKRGLFGTVFLFIENKFHIEFIESFNLFFIIFYLLNIILFFLIIRQYSKFYYIFLFLALSPTLILFSFNDLGGYQRFDAISIFLILFHTYLINLYRSKKISFINYKKKIFLIILPFIFVSIFIHEIQCWSIPFHFLMIKSIYDENNIKYKNLLIYFSPLFFASIVIFFYPISEQTINSMIERLSERNLWTGAIAVASSSEGNLNILNYEIETNLLNFYNLKINLFFLLMGIIPINILLIFLKKKKLINIKNKYIFSYFYLSIIPYLSFFAIGDTGRWIHMISIISFSFLGQYPLRENIYYYNKYKSLISKVILLILLIVYCFFIRLPHGGNLQEKKITIWGGLNKKFEAAYIIYFGKNIGQKFDLNYRFKKNNGK